MRWSPSCRTERRIAIRGRDLATFCFGLVCSLLASSLNAFSMECTGSGATITAPVRTDAEPACEAARYAVTFLAVNGLHITAPIEVRLVSELPQDRVREGMFACYSHLDNTVHVLTLSSLRNLQDSFGLKIDSVLHQGVVAHEVAHAVAALNFAVEQPSSVAQEYIAYVTQLATLPTNRREDILARFSDEPLRPGAAVNKLLLAMDPGRFAVRAYRHFVNPGNGAAFLQRVLTGAALAGDTANGGPMTR